MRVDGSSTNKLPPQAFTSRLWQITLPTSTHSCLTLIRPYSRLEPKKDQAARTPPRNDSTPFPADYGIENVYLGECVPATVHRRRSNHPGISQAQGPGRHRTLEREGLPSTDGESHFDGEALRYKRQRGSQSQSDN